jgi:hypothetical protein
MSCNNNTLVISLIGQAIGQLRAGEYSLVVIPVYLLYKAIHVRTLAYYFTYYTTHLKKLRRVEEGAKNFGVFRVKNHDFTPKNYIVSNCGGRRENVCG